MKHTLIFFALIFAVTVSAQSTAQKAPLDNVARNKCTFVNSALVECKKPASRVENRCHSHHPKHMWINTYCYYRGLKPNKKH